MKKPMKILNLAEYDQKDAKVLIGKLTVELVMLPVGERIKAIFNDAEMVWEKVEESKTETVEAAK